MRHGILTVLWLATAAPALAQAPNDAAKAMTDGTWEFSNADRDKRCTLTFKTDAAPGGMKLEFDKACAEAFPFIKEVAGWTIADNDFLRLNDAKGKSLLEFSEVETGMFEAPKPGEGILFIQTMASVGPPPKPADQVAGDWSIARGDGSPLCALSLSTAPSGDALALRVKPGCDAAVTRFAPNAWQMDRGELVLRNARGQTWRFEESDSGGSWQRVPEGPEPLLLVRP